MQKKDEDSILDKTDNNFDKFESLHSLIWKPDSDSHT